MLFSILFTGMGNKVIASTVLDTQQNRVKHYITQRGNLTNSFHKFTYEKKGCVAFLGGSITEGRMEKYDPGRFKKTFS